MPIKSLISKYVGQNSQQNGFRVYPEASLVLLNWQDLYAGGNLVFTRASEASFVDPRDNWGFKGTNESSNWLGSNIPRIFEDGAILIEPSARTNFLSQSRNPSLAGAWTLPPGGGGNSITASVIDGPDGLLSGAEIKVNAGAFSRAQVPSIGTVQPRVVSCYARIVATQTTMSINVGSGSIFVKTLNNATFQRFTSSTLLAGGIAQLYPIDATIISSSQHIYGDLWQFESGAFATSVIRSNNASSTTRAAEDVRVSGSKLPQAMLSDGFEFDYYPEFAAGTNANRLPAALRLVSTVANSTVNVTIDQNTTATRVVIQTPTASTNTGFFIHSPYDKITVRVNFVAGTLSVYQTGSLFQTVTGLNGSWITAMDEVFVFGQHPAFNLPFFGVMSNFRRL